MFKTFCVLLSASPREAVPFLPFSSLWPSDLALEASNSFRLCDLQMEIVIFNIEMQQHFLQAPEWDAK
jgi:hypothetical protein